jgi:sugar phosphate isomerase/epimerase
MKDFIQLTGRMKLGISSYTFTWAVGVKDHLPENPLTWRGLLDLAQELGVGLIQIADNMPLNKLTEDELESLIRIASDKGIELEAGTNNMTTENLELYLTIAERIRSKILRFVIDGENFKPAPVEVISKIRDVESEFRKRKIILALENHDRFQAHQFRKIIEDVGSPYVGICLDCANSFGAGEGFREVVNLLAPYVVNLHLKEILIKRKYHKMGFDIEGRPFGEGCLPLEWILSQLAPECRTAILELWTPPENTIQQTIKKEIEWAEKSIRYLTTHYSQLTTPY